MSDDTTVRGRRRQIDAGRTRMERRQDRRGRNLVEGWVVAAVAVAIVLASTLVVRAMTGGKPKLAVPAGSPKVAAAAVGGGSGAEASETATPVFGKMGKYGVEMHFPAIPDDMVAIGFHQAWNLKATDMKPSGEVHARDKYANTKAALKKDPSLKLFLMMSRGRGSSQYSAADCAVKPGAIVLSPVTGVVTLVKTYQLSGVGSDYHIEIKADGAEAVRVVLIHLQDVTVKTGERVEGGVTPLATVRHLKIDSQVNRYLPVAADHTHMQINAVGYKLNEGS